MKRAVALCGGGTKGSYELGAWQALRELNIDYQIVTGTSIGSINGAMMVCEDFENARILWETIEMEKVMEDGINLSNTIEGMYNQKDALRPFLKKYVQNKGADVSPFEKFIAELIDEKKVRSSKIDFGLVTVQMSPLKPMELRIQDIPEGLLQDYIMCSSAIFPLFPMHKIGNKSYVDGCYYDNLPIDLALKMGADEVIAIDLHQNISHPEYLNKPFVTYIYPRKNLGTMMNFEREILDANILMGYQDTMKTFGKMCGFDYVFETNSLEGYQEKIEEYLSKILRVEYPAKEVSGFLKPERGKRVCAGLEEHTQGKIRTKEDYFLRGAEICGTYFGVPSEKTYRMEEFLEILKEQKAPIPKTGDPKEQAAELFLKVCI